MGTYSNKLMSDNEAIKMAMNIRTICPEFGWTKISKKVGRSVTWIRNRLEKGFKEARHARRYRKSHHVEDAYDGLSAVQRHARWLKMIEERPEDTRDITGRLMGDPLPGRSALDRRDQHAV